jgi:gamma-glutamyltranspeptidase/glutathione hydrolase
MLHILEGYPLREWGFHSAAAVHVQIEAMRHAYFDRNNTLGDPEFVNNPIGRLLDKAYAAKVRAAIDPARAAISVNLKPGTAPHEGSNTTHYSIVDGSGNAVAVTYTLNDWFGAKVTAAGTGCCSTTRWTTSPPSSAWPTTTAWFRARRTRSRPASGRSAR